MYDLHNAYNYENIVFIYYVKFSIRVSFACEFILKNNNILIGTFNDCHHTSENETQKN
jgi:hypothetical protein